MSASLIMVQFMDFAIGFLDLNVLMECWIAITVIKRLFELAYVEICRWSYIFPSAEFDPIIAGYDSSVCYTN